MNEPEPEFSPEEIARARKMLIGPALMACIAQMKEDGLAIEAARIAREQAEQEDAA